MIIPDVIGRGWSKKNELIIPIWFIGDQFPPTLTKSKEDETSVKNGEPGNKKRKIRSRMQEYSIPCPPSSSSDSSEWEQWHADDFVSDSYSDDSDW